MEPYYDRGGITLYNADCLAVLPQLPAQSVDLVCADLPYGTTACAWDSIIPLDALWREYKRVCKPSAALVFTASQPFTTALISSNLAWFRYCWVWDKKLPGNFMLAQRQPMKVHEDVCVFAPTGAYTYNPQMTKGARRRKGGGFSTLWDVVKTTSHSDDYYPVSILEYGNTDRAHQLHPTQKPLGLIEYLLRTYSNPGDLVLDNAFGSGTTARAAKNLGRRFVGMEKDTTEGYCQIAVDRLAQEVLALAV